MQISLRYPTASMKEAILDLKKEFFEYGIYEISGSAHLDTMPSFEEWLQFVENNRSAGTVTPEWVVSDVFLAFDENDEIVGIIDLRHYLNDLLEEYGHCGYSVRPTRQGNGYAVQMLSAIKKFARELGMEVLHMATFQDNYASVKTILRNGGVWMYSFVAEGRKAEMYKIQIEND